MNERRFHSRQILALAGGILVFGLVLTAIVLMWIPGGASSSFFLFLGRLHPIILHLPIGIILLVAIFELIFPHWISSRETQEQMLIILILGAAGAVVAALTGLILSQEGGHEGDLISWHKWAGIAVALGTVSTVLLKVLSLRASRQARLIYRPTLFITVVLILAAGHYGGQLTHGQDYLTEHLPGFIKSWVGLTPETPSLNAANIMEARLFEQLVQPVLNTHCIECHGEATQRGNLRLDTLESIRKGGEHGPVLMAGDPNGSEIYRRLILPLENEDRMPPGTRTPVPIIDTEILRWWIEQGADPKLTIADAGEAPAAVQAYLKRLGAGSRNDESPVMSLELPPPDPDAIRALEQRGAMITPIVQGKNHLNIQVSYAGPEFGDAELELLSPLANHVVILNLAGTGITDAGLEALSDLKNLVRLHLERTSITGEGLKVLEKFPALEYLNLYGTEISDEALDYLHNNPALESVYLWDTQVSTEAIEELQQSNPQLQVSTGVFGAFKESSSESADSPPPPADVPPPATPDS